MVSPKTRYLVFFQYFGSKYSGVMETSTDQSLLGVQNYLEKAAQNLKSVIPIKFHISSRTDAGVHALCNSAHLDIQRAPGKAPLHPGVLVRSLNHYLKPEPIRLQTPQGRDNFDLCGGLGRIRFPPHYPDEESVEAIKEKFPVRECLQKEKQWDLQDRESFSLISNILSAHRVADSFHARFSACSRTYVYRLLLGCSHHSEIPVFERDLCWAPAGGSLNVPAMQDAAGFLLGTHDFSTFRSLSSETPVKSPVRTILQAEIRPSAGLLSHHYEYRGLEFWELEFRSRSFLYRQVRRMAGALVAVGQGKLSPRHIKELLEKKDSLAFPPHAMAPPSGLFLKSVAYNEADLETGTTAE